MEDRAKAHPWDAKETLSPAMDILVNSRAAVVISRI